ncbi:hypothetical protein RN001_006030 [Aquatica leii]|uniref:Uncharacterized protein n=1 Tax=Aquatica leii TaxID=1421715 RepID=A0AAN7PKN4_9COLE|nr:hypothetical protein RN001_006030 [Aquatica leii]
MIIEFPKIQNNDFLDYASLVMDDNLCKQAQIVTKLQNHTNSWYELTYGRINSLKIYEAAHYLFHIPAISITAETEGDDDGPEVFPLENTNIDFDVRSMESPLVKPDEVINFDTVSIPEIGSSVDLKKSIEISNEIILYVRSMDDRLRKIEKNFVVVRKYKILLDS